MLPTLLCINTYMWLILYLFIKFYPFYFDFFKAAFQYSIVGVPVVFVVLHFENPSTNADLLKLYFATD
jgi:hypothetical protein